MLGGRYLEILPVVMDTGTIFLTGTWGPLKHTKLSPANKPTSGNFTTEIIKGAQPFMQGHAALFRTVNEMGTS